jgi:hypothetical protein
MIGNGRISRENARFRGPSATMQDVPRSLPLLNWKKLNTIRPRRCERSLGRMASLLLPRSGGWAIPIADAGMSCGPSLAPRSPRPATSSASRSESSSLAWRCLNRAACAWASLAIGSSPSSPATCSFTSTYSATTTPPRGHLEFETSSSSGMPSRKWSKTTSSLASAVGRKAMTWFVRAPDSASGIGSRSGMARSRVSSRSSIDRARPRAGFTFSWISYDGGQGWSYPYPRWPSPEGTGLERPLENRSRGPSPRKPQDKLFR